MSQMPIYLDCNASTPIEPRVLTAMTEFMSENYGNAGSRTHIFGNNAKKMVNKAREHIAAVVACKRDEVVFTSGATESNNLAILGLKGHGETSGRKHIISTQIEHKAVLEPLDYLERLGFEIDLIAPTSEGKVDPCEIQNKLRPDTLLVSMMHVNNETGMIQPVGELCSLLKGHEAYLHVDAAQGFGKKLEDLRDLRIDMISVSGHKIYGPKGIGALVVRRRGFEQIPLRPLMFGGGQERSLRPGTLPVELIVGFGVAAETANNEHELRQHKWRAFRNSTLAALSELDFVFNCDPESTVLTTLNLAIPGIDSEALMVALKDEIAFSNGSACTSTSYRPSHVLEAMGLQRERIEQSFRISWCHTTPTPDWATIIGKIRGLI